MEEPFATELASPYPGLRPFKDSESVVFFGRESQVNEVLNRLAAQRFVVVLGGSGSGKSSLIRAGVVPSLRSYQLPNAGDVWMPVIATPGTDQGPSSYAQHRRFTPIDRLAAKVAAALPASAAQSSPPDPELLNRIAAALRERDGLHKLYAEVLPLKTFEGPPTESFQQALRDRCNLLIVLDQFEEIFHPSNVGLEDCARLVERVLEHHEDGHPQIYLILTMRSEYLNRCSAYLRLPDAINKASYLVRRLSPFEIDQCISLPACHYLSILAHRRVVDDSLEPVEDHGVVEFEAAVLKRLRDDVEKLNHEPDHLPLLQHLLARLWDRAAERALGDGRRAPDRIDIDDLKWAVGAGETNQLLTGNVLQLAVENWAERAWRRLGESREQQLVRLLPRLAFKDPNSGEEVQRRLQASEGTALLGPNVDESALRSLLQPFLDLDYFHWDEENREAVSVKVSHESFIRGWSRFRDCVAREADGFSDFMEALRQADTCANGGNDAKTGLLGQELIDRLSKRGFDVERDVTSQAIGNEWIRILAIKNDSRRWLPLVDKLPDLGATSLVKLKREKGLRKTLRNLAVAASVVFLGALVLWLHEWSTGTKLDTLYRTLRDANALPAGGLAHDLSTDDVATQGVARALQIARRWSEANGRGDETMLSTILSGVRWVGDRVPYVDARQRRESAELHSEEGVGQMLERVLDQLPLIRKAGNQTNARAPTSIDRGQCGAAANACWCLVAEGNDKRSIQIMQFDSEANWTLELLAATNNKCEKPKKFYSLLPNTPVYFDSSLRHMLFASPHPVISRLHWFDGPDAGVERGAVFARPLVRASVLASSIKKIESEAKDVRVAILAIGKRQGRFEIELPGKKVEFVDLEPRQTDALGANRWTELTARESTCSIKDELGRYSLIRRLKEGKSSLVLCEPPNSLVEAPSTLGAADVVREAASSDRKSGESLVATFNVPDGVMPVEWKVGKGDRTGWLGFTAVRKGDFVSHISYELPLEISARERELSALISDSR